MSPEKAPQASLTIPLLDREPKLDKTFSDGEWEGAARLAGTFHIAQGNAADGDYPFAMWVGCRPDGLRIALRISDVGENPYSPPEGPWYSDLIVLMFASGADGPIPRPSDAFFISHHHKFGNSNSDGYWTGASWARQPEPTDGSFNEGQPSSGRWFRGWAAEDELFLEGFINRGSTLPAHDGLRLEAGDEFRVALRLTREDGNDSTDSDVWPGEGSSPDADLDATEWPVLQYGC